jgi:YD repeat-containing protein
MTRGLWFASLLATLFGAWGAARAGAIPGPACATPGPYPSGPRPTEADGPTKWYVYDASNRCIRQYDPRGPVTTYRYVGHALPGSGA